MISLLLQFHLQYTHYVVWLLRILRKRKCVIQYQIFSVLTGKLHVTGLIFLFASYWWRFLYDVKRLKVSTFRRFLLLYEKEFEMSLVDSSAQFLSERWNFWQRWSARTSLFLGSSYQNNKKGKEARRIFASYLVVLGAVPSTFMAYFLSRNFP